MSENCSQNCSTCLSDCEERKVEKTDFSLEPHELSSIKKVIGVVSGKGGVGKSIVTSLLAVMMNRREFHTAILDADVTGPSIPKVFGIKEKAAGDENGIFPARSKTGIDIMSVNLLLKHEADPVVWRGPIIANMVKQFWTDVIWSDVDFLFIDMPPGTGDVPLTVFQSIAVDGIIVVTSPQELVSMIVTKAVRMAEMMNIPILGIVENMSYFKCPDNGKEYKIFGESHIDEVAREHNLKVLAKIPIDTKISASCDKGLIELFEGDYLDGVADVLEKMEEKEMIRVAVACEGTNVTEHFGHCQNFYLFDVENNTIVKSESIPNPGHKPGFLPNYLHDKGVKVIISGGMGQGAIDIFNDKGIEVIVGASGDAKLTVQAYINGQLKSTGSVCHEHQHHDEC